MSTTETMEFAQITEDASGNLLGTIQLLNNGNNNTVTIINASGIDTNQMVILASVSTTNVDVLLQITVVVDASNNYTTLNAVLLNNTDYFSNAIAAGTKPLYLPATATVNQTFYCPVSYYLGPSNGFCSNSSLVTPVYNYIISADSAGAVGYCGSNSGDYAISVTSTNSSSQVWTINVENDSPALFQSMIPFGFTSLLSGCVVSGGKFTYIPWTLASTGCDGTTEIWFLLGVGYLGWCAINDTQS